MDPNFTGAVLSRPTPNPHERRATVASTIAEELTRARIRHIPYVPGGPMMPFVQAAHELGLLRFVLCRHEQGAGFIAEGQARVLRRPSVVLVTAGPGVTNLVTPIYVAKQEMTSMLVISAQVSRQMNGKGAAQELDTVELLKPITKRSVALSQPAETRALLRSLLEEARTPDFGPVHLSVASDLWLQEVA